MTATICTSGAVPGPGPGPGPGSGPDVRELVARAQGGDAEAFGALYEHYVGTVHQFLFHRVRRDRPLAEDLTSEVFVRALRGIDKFAWVPGSTFGGWLLTIARNIVIDHTRSRRMRSETVTDPVDVAPQYVNGLGWRRMDGTPAAGADTDPETAAVTHQTNLALLRAVNRLPAEQREVVLLRFWMQLSTHETAKVLGTNVGAVKSRQYRAMRTLARAVPAENPRANPDTNLDASVDAAAVTR